MEKQIAVLHSACEHLGLETRFVDSNQNVMQVQFPWGYEYFRINRTPFNSEVVAEICRDKMHTYELLSPYINLPITRSYLDVNVAPKYRQYLTHTSLEAIVEDVELHFSLPVVVKMNSGALGTGVFLSESPEQVRNAFQTNHRNTITLRWRSNIFPTRSNTDWFALLMSLYWFISAGRRRDLMPVTGRIRRWRSMCLILKLLSG